LILGMTDEDTALLVAARLEGRLLQDGNWYYVRSPEFGWGSSIVVKCWSLQETLIALRHGPENLPHMTIAWR
jgi:hypothetical protein